MTFNELEQIYDILQWTDGIVSDKCEEDFKVKVKEAIKIIDREILLRTMDPRKKHDNDYFDH